MDVLISICVQVIGINTVARSGSPDYLLRTLRALRVSSTRHDLSSFFETKGLFRLLLWRSVNGVYLFWSRVLSIVAITQVGACYLHLYTTALLKLQSLT
jgi:hypothetical protein